MAYEVCAINHETYWLNHGTIVPGSFGQKLGGEILRAEKRMGNGERTRICRDLREYMVRREAEGLGGEAEAEG